ncbi:hypothetical protein VNO77_04197 [Canavalia gladiata]|uniref:Uncharacterized protein n=1 Tax=Canavalia gladiata TaxID=3824 RepID=A0AAN9MWS2_CANGL
MKLIELKRYRWINFPKKRINFPNYIKSSVRLRGHASGTRVKRLATFEFHLHCINNLSALSQPTVFAHCTISDHRCLRPLKITARLLQPGLNLFSVTMAKRKGRGRPKGLRVQKKVKESADAELVIPNSPSNGLKVEPGFIEEQEAGANGLKVEPGFIEEQESDTSLPKKKGRGRPKGSMAQNCHESVRSSLNSLNDPSNMVEVCPGCEESEDAVMPRISKRGRPRGSTMLNCQENADVMPRRSRPGRPRGSTVQNCQENADVMPRRSRRGQPRGSTVQNCQEKADGLAFSLITRNSERGKGLIYMMFPWALAVEYYGMLGSNCLVLIKVFEMPGKRGLEQPGESMNYENHQQNADGKLDVFISVLVIIPGCRVLFDTYFVCCVSDIIVKPKKGGRGQAKGLKLQLKRQRSADGKLDVVIHPTKLVPVGPGRNDFITDLSLIVRANARLNVKSWRQVPKSIKDTIVQNILNNWRLPDTDMVRKAILDEAHHLYSNWRTRLHDYYMMYETKEEALMHVPDDINDSDWHILVDYFSSPWFETVSGKNKANRAKQRMNHTSGSKSFLAVSYDARDQVTGKEPNMQTLWQLTHKRANGEWVDEASKEVNDKVAEQINEKRCQVEDSQDQMETIEPEIINTAFKTVVGAKSYMPGFEAGVSLSSSSVRFQRLQAEFDAQKRETENARKECNEIRARLVEVESQLEKEQLKRKEIEACLLNRQNGIQEINSQVQTAIQSALSQYLPPRVEAVNSSMHRRKIADLEAQLHEAEDVITDIRSELIWYRTG